MDRKEPVNIEVGDSFKVDWDIVKHEQEIVYGYKFVKCKTPNKVFIVDKFSKSMMTIYYRDYRTNNGCKCRICTGNYFNTTKRVFYNPGESTKTINKMHVILHEKKLQRERNIKLKQLGI